jgi:hypothetical protein
MRLPSFLPKSAEYKLYYFEGRNTGIAARSASEAKEKKKRGGDKIVGVRTPNDSEKKQMEKGVWVRTRVDGKSPEKSQHGKGRGYGPPRKKEASSFINDVALRDLDEKTTGDIKRFSPSKAWTKFPQYGMVVSELVTKADPKNLQQARAHIKKKSDKEANENFYGKLKKKFILLVNDRIVDGHHFLALAEKCKATCSLNVLDLTPARFQKSGQQRFDKVSFLPGLLL